EGRVSRGWDQTCFSGAQRQDARQRAQTETQTISSEHEEILFHCEGDRALEEIAPAEGLVSILKKRDDREGKTIAQVQQRQTKRRVRFQEMEDTLDQDEVAGGSCILLILLCIATVFLSVGGTALYCTFGDMESPVCTDFAANVDFYYTQILQRMEELKHWIAFS
uniref:Consortin C-terminal domain-containing protein n=1 Tax=Apteryx owenii TaxID=8824 RepID=A0A8B9P6I8_APTOW